MHDSAKIAREYDGSHSCRIEAIRGAKPEWRFRRIDANRTARDGRRRVEYVNDVATQPLAAERSPYRGQSI